MSEKTELPANPAFEPEAFARNLARLMENGSRALGASMKPRENGEARDNSAEELAHIVRTFHSIANYWLSDPDRAAELQTRLGKAYLDLVGSAGRRLAGEGTPAALIEPAPNDKRFRDPEWQSNQFFDFLKQAYL